MKKTYGRVLLAALCLFILGAFVAIKFYLPRSKVYGWGLRYSSTAVRGPISPKEAAEYHAYYTSDNFKLYLTVDCGYENGHTLSILDTLKEYDVPAAFFITGSIVKNAPDTARALADSGYIVGNHTLTHPDLATLSRAGWIEELTQVEELYEQLTGKPLDKYCRFPEGRFSRQALDWTDKLGYTTIFWGAACSDWDMENQPTVEEELEVLLGRIRGGSVILLHNTSPTTAQCLGQLIEACQAQGYTFASLEEFKEFHP